MKNTHPQLELIKTDPNLSVIHFNESPNKHAIDLKQNSQRRNNFMETIPVINNPEMLVGPE